MGKEEGSRAWGEVARRDMTWDETRELCFARCFAVGLTPWHMSGALASQAYICLPLLPTCNVRITPFTQAKLFPAPGEAKIPTRFLGFL